MDKKKLLEIMMEQLEQDKVALLEATRATLEAATHEESKPENEYDTRGLEASYLAGAQSKRVAEIEEAYAICRNVQVKKYGPDDPIGPTAFVMLDCDGKKSFVFLMPKVGGITIRHEEKVIQVISGHSPLGEAISGLKVGGVGVVEKGDLVREYEILSVE